jgi:hypothetical protein
MFVSRSKFYKAVTGTTTANSAIVEPALKRWGVPYMPNGTKGDAVDIVHLETAKKIWEAEKAAREERAVARGRRPTQKARANPDALAANTDALKDVQAALLLVAEEMGKLTAILSERRKA